MALFLSCNPLFASFSPSRHNACGEPERIFLYTSWRVIGMYGFFGVSISTRGWPHDMIVPAGEELQNVRIIENTDSGKFGFLVMK